MQHLLLFFNCYTEQTCLLCAHVTLQRQRLLLCHLWDTPRQSVCSISLGKTKVFSSSLWINPTASFPSHPFNARIQCLPFYTIVPALALLVLVSSMSPSGPASAVAGWVSVINLMLSWAGNFSSLSLCISTCTLQNILYLQETSSNPPHLYVTQLPIFKTVQIKKQTSL